MRLSSFDNRSFVRGAPWWVEAVWACFGSLLLESRIPGSKWRLILLSMFGADVSIKAVLKPCVKVKFPWRLSIESDCWIGEGVWIDNLDYVYIKSNSCISQGVYFCTGSHDWSKDSFDLITRPIVVCEDVWVGAFSRIGPGVVLSKGTVCTLGSVVTKSSCEFSILAGNPAIKIKSRVRI